MSIFLYIQFIIFMSIFMRRDEEEDEERDLEEEDEDFHAYDERHE